jgi:hypothetical protein
MGAVSQQPGVREVVLRRDAHGFSYLDCMAHMVKHSLNPPEEMCDPKMTPQWLRLVLLAA